MTNKLEKVVRACSIGATVVLGVGAIGVGYGLIGNNDDILFNSLKVATGAMAVMGGACLTAGYLIKDYKQDGKNI
ncbi:MAG: hypothetical protein WC584_02805 [Candidatus Pacearchaeota archaeon]